MSHATQSSGSEPTAALQPAATDTASACGCGGSCGGGCPSCTAAKLDAAPIPTYALGRIRPRIPTLGLEKEIAQLTGHKPTLSKSDEEALCTVLAAPEHEYLAREVCWVFSVGGVDSFYSSRYVDSTTLRWVLSTARPDKGPTDVDVVIGRLAGRASMVECNGLVLPTVLPVQVYSFDQQPLASR